MHGHTYRSLFYAASLSLVSLLLLSNGCSQVIGPANAKVPEIQPVTPANALPRTGGSDMPIPPGGTPLLPADVLSVLTFGGQPDQGSATIVPVSGQPFATAARLTSIIKPANIWDMQAVVNATGSVHRGDVLLVSFYARCIEGQKESGEARTAIVFEQQGDPWTKYLDHEVAVSKEWKRFTFPLQMREEPPPAGAHLCFRMGYDKQVFEIADLKLLNFGPSVNIADLPRTRVTYPGMEENAPWRKAANERIEKIRKGDVTILVRDASGKPVMNANVALRMQRHAFGFGSAVSDAMIRANGPDGDKYRDWVTKYCSKAVIENDLKWQSFEGNPEAGKHVVAYLNEHHIAVKGHNLVWPSWRWLPGDLPALKGDKEKLARRVDDHIKSEVTAFKGQVVEWDVINEPFANHDLQDILGNDAMVHWFQLARATDPKPRLLLNDYPPLDGSAVTDDHLNHFYQTIDFLQKKGAPVEGIGFQCHFGGTPIPPKDLLSGLDRFSKFGLPISITEFDMNTNDTTLQAAYMRDFMTAAFSQPSVDTILIWGFWEGAHWLPDAALYSRDWTLRPHGKVFQDLVTKIWWTNVDRITDEKGIAKARGFYGDYQLTVTSPSPATGTTKTIPITIVKGAKNVFTVTL